MPKFTNSETLQKYLKEMKNFPVLEHGEEKILLQKIKKGDQDARQKLVTGNLRLVVKIAFSFTETQSMNILDYIQEGNKGLLIATEKFDFNTGNAFSTYATYCIRRHIQRAIDNCAATIRKPCYLCDQSRLYEKAKKKLEMETGMVPTIEIIAREMDMPYKEVLKIYNANRAMLSTDADLMQNKDSKPDNRGRHVTALDLNGDDIDIERDCVNEIYSEEIRNTIKTILNEEQYLVLKHYYGLEKETPKNIKEISEITNISYNKTRSLITSAISKLKRNSERISAMLAY